MNFIQVPTVPQNHRLMAAAIHLLHVRLLTYCLPGPMISHHASNEVWGGADSSEWGWDAGNGSNQTTSGNLRALGELRIVVRL